MKFGLCASHENISLVERLGFDYIECAVSSIAALSDDNFRKVTESFKSCSIVSERFNMLFPKTIALVGPDVNRKEIDAYLEKAFGRITQLGGKLVVFGSGRSRSFPAEYPFRKGYAELVDITKRIGAIAKNHGLTIAIEPLNTEESNCINSVKEGAMLQADVGLESVGLLADLYHILRENEKLEYLDAVKEFNHIHVALLEGRGYPVTVTAELKTFFRILTALGYDGTVSIEGKTENIEQEGAGSLDILRSLVAGRGN